MTERCFDLTELDGLLDLAPADPRREHLARCPLCRARLAAYRAFLANQPAPGSRPAQAEAALSRFIDATVGAAGAEAAPAPGAPPPPSRPGRIVGFPAALGRTPRQRRILAPALAMAAVLALCLLWAPPRHGPEGPSGRLRHEPPAAYAPTPRAPSDQTMPATSTTGETGLTAAAEVREDGGVTFCWRAWPGADGYRVQLFDARLVELTRYPAGADTALSVAASQLPATSGLLLWRVQALREKGEIARSRPAVLDRRRR